MDPSMFFTPLSFLPLTRDPALPEAAAAAVSLVFFFPNNPPNNPFFFFLSLSGIAGGLPDALDDIVARVGSFSPFCEKCKTSTSSLCN